MSKTTPSRILLTGFMGCGKSKLGRELAKLMKINFADTDHMIEAIAGKSAGRIIEEDGTSAFRELENEVLRRVLVSPGDQVVAFGGGAICTDANLKLALEYGLLVYIKLSPEELFLRLKTETSQRPLLGNSTGAELLQTIRDLLLTRENYYSRAHITVNGMGLDAPELFRTICAAASSSHT